MRYMHTTFNFNRSRELKQFKALCESWGIDSELYTLQGYRIAPVISVKAGCKPLTLNVYRLQYMWDKGGVSLTYPEDYHTELCDITWPVW